MTAQHTVVLHGPAANADRVSAHLFRDLLDVLVEGAERALRFRIEGRSSARGTQPAWLRPASDFALIRAPHLGAATALIEAKPLIVTMPDRFKQGDFFADLDPRQSPIELFERALEDALRGDEDSDRYDAMLIRTFERLGGLFDAGVERMEIINGRTIQVDAPAIERVRTISAKSYAAQKVRVAGRLETIRYSDCRFSLVLESGAQLQGTALDLGQGALRGHFGELVVITATAIFRPSGKPLRLEAERIERASERDAKIWSMAPKPLLAPHPGRELREEQRGKKGFSALLGMWPGDETEEQVKVALEAIS